MNWKCRGTWLPTSWASRRPTSSTTARATSTLSARNAPLSQNLNPCLTRAGTVLPTLSISSSMLVCRHHARLRPKSVTPFSKWQVKIATKTKVVSKEPNWPEDCSKAEVTMANSMPRSLPLQSNHGARKVLRTASRIFRNRNTFPSSCHKGPSSQPLPLRSNCQWKKV